MKKETYGTFYLVAMPIGHEDDITLRAQKVLQSTPIIICEDTRHTALFLKKKGLLEQQLLLRGDAYKEAEIIPLIESKLLDGQDVAIVSDSGSIGICDPGALIVTELRAKGFRISALPGACAVITFLSLCGYRQSSWHFLGFFPREKKESTFQMIQQQGGMWIAYESPHRLLETLEVAAQHLCPQSTILRVAKELTKTFEDYWQGSISEVLADLQSHREKIKGEWVIAFECIAQKQEDWQKAALSLAELVGKKTAAVWIAEHFSVGKNTVYQYLIKPDLSL